MGILLSDMSSFRPGAERYSIARRPGESVREWYSRTLVVWEGQMRSLMGVDAAKALFASLCEDHACRLACLEREEEELRRQPFMGTRARV